MSAKLSLLLVTILTCFGAGSGLSQIPAAADSTRARTALLRFGFIERVRALGFTCPIEPPEIVVEDVPSFGQYDDQTNTLHTSDWALLNPHEKSFFTQLAGPGADEAATRAVFEKAAHGWIFVHELGHWWQACNKGFIAHHTHWEVEYGANRIALAYWRETDPAISTLMMRLFHQVLDGGPSPVPAGATLQSYFNENYERLGPTPAYPWFQAIMGVMLDGEKPAPSLKAALATELTGQGASAGAPTANSPRPDPAAREGADSGEGGGRVTPVRVLSQASPEFSVEARRKKISGNVLVGLVVDVSGRPTQVHVVRSIAEGQPAELRDVALSLDVKALEAVQQYRFAPAMRDGRPLPVAMKIEVNFQIF